MPRRPRIATGGYVYHVLNRSVGRQTLFESDADYAAFLRILTQACHREPDARLLGYCVMPNHWHLVLWPRRDGQLSQFMRWLTVTHTQRWHAHRRTAGTGPVYQGRFKSFPIQNDDHLAVALRYVERNALTAGLVPQAQAWRWGSCWQAHCSRHLASPEECPPLSDWPAPRPRHWLALVNQPITRREQMRIQTCITRGRPLGDDHWTTTTAATLSLTPALRPRGRPKKELKT